MVEQNEKRTKTVFNPEETNITRGAEIFVGNNSSSPQSITSGTGPDDPLSGKLFDTGVIKSKGYAEFVTANLNPGSKIILGKIGSDILFLLLPNTRRLVVTDRNFSFPVCVVVWAIRHLAIILSTPDMLLLYSSVCR